MTAMPVESTDEELLEALEWQPPCGVKLKHIDTVLPPAVFAVFGKIPMPCGCTAPRPLVLMCAACWDSYQGSHIRCPRCQTRTSFMETVRKVVRL